MEFRKYILLLGILIFSLFSCKEKQTFFKEVPVAALMGKNLDELEKELGKPEAFQEFPESSTLSEKVRLIYDAEFFGKQGELLYSIDNKSHKVSFIQFYAEGGDFTNEWIKEIQAAIGSPYTLSAWKKAIKKDLLYKDRTPKLIESLYNQGAREWPLTKNNYKYELASAEFMRPKNQTDHTKSPDPELVEATWLRIFDMSYILESKKKKN